MEFTQFCEQQLDEFTRKIIGVKNNVLLWENSKREVVKTLIELLDYNLEDLAKIKKFYGIYLNHLNLDEKQVLGKIIQKLVDEFILDINEFHVIIRNELLRRNTMAN